MPDADLPLLFEETGIFRDPLPSFGTWDLCLITGLQSWSPGFYRLLGYAPGSIRPDHRRFLDALDPADRPALGLAALTEEGAVFRRRIVGLQRADGAARLLSVDAEIRRAPDGRPLAASGIAVDVTDRTLLARARDGERRQREALFRHHRSWTTTVRYNQRRGLTVPSAELLALTGLDPAELAGDPSAMVAVRERPRLRDLHLVRSGGVLPYLVTLPLRLAGGGDEPFRMAAAPLLTEAGAVEAWIVSSAPAGRPADPGTDLRRALEQHIAGHHLRAARGLLDWSMSDLAAASGLSLSTIRRLEEDAEGPSSRSRVRAVAALRQAGIGFLLLDTGAIAIVGP